MMLLVLDVFGRLYSFLPGGGVGCCRMPNAHGCYISISSLARGPGNSDDLVPGGSGHQSRSSNGDVGWPHGRSELSNIRLSVPKSTKA